MIGNSLLKCGPSALNVFGVTRMKTKNKNKMLLATLKSFLLEM